MRNPIEAGRAIFHAADEKTRGPKRDYIGSVLARATGVDSYQRWQKNGMSNTFPFVPDLVIPVVQVAFPNYVDAVIRASTDTKSGDFSVRKFMENLPVGVADGLYYSLLLLPMAMSHPVETALIKTAINIGSPIASDLYHAGLDLAAKGVNRLKSHLPTSLVALSI